jgi:hypothetical protein
MSWFKDKQILKIMKNNQKTGKCGACRHTNQCIYLSLPPKMFCNKKKDFVKLNDKCSLFKDIND